MKRSVSLGWEWHAGALDIQMRAAVKVERLRTTYLFLTISWMPSLSRAGLNSS